MLQKIIKYDQKIAYAKDRTFKRNKFDEEQNILKYIRGFLGLIIFLWKNRRNIALGLNPKSRVPNSISPFSLVYLLNITPFINLLLIQILIANAKF